MKNTFITTIKSELKEAFEQVKAFLKWAVLSLITGLVVGAFSTAFSWCMTKATAFRMEHFIIIPFLPLAGLVIVFLYHIFHMDKDKGTNKVISTVNADEDDDGNGIPFQMAPLIFISTVLTHLFGGSAGREGAALQLGGSLGHKIGDLFHLQSDDKKIITMSGMSAAFSALFGTPMAAAIFPMEMVCIGSMNYFALVPCVLASLAASHFAASMGISPEAFTILEIPDFTIPNAAKILLLGALCGFVSILFCKSLHQAGHLYSKYIKNPYIRIFAAGCIIVLLTLIVGNTDYNGAGIPVIERAMEGEVFPLAFLLKIIFTALTLGAGYKGGEIVPSFFIGATFGCLLGQILGISPSMCAAIGLVAVFCGATNCPISSILIAFELFGFGGVPYFLIAISVSYMLSGYSSLYHNQLIRFSKTKAIEVNISGK